MPQQRGCLFATISNPFYYQKITLYLFSCYLYSGPYCLHAA